MRGILTFVLILLFFWGVHSQRIFLILGETGVGKSTITSTIFGVKGVEIGHGLKSTTSEVNGYIALDFFPNDLVLDSPGLYDTNDVPDEEILTKIEFKLLEKKNSEQVQDHVDAFILIFNAQDRRAQVEKTLAKYTEILSPSFLSSLVIILNIESSTTKEQIENYSKRINEVLQRQNSAAPLVVMNCLTPSDRERESLKKGIFSVKPFPLHKIHQKEKEIQKIYDKIIADPDNYKTIVQNIVEYENRTITREQLQRVSKEVTVTKCFETPQTFSIAGIFETSSTKVTCRDETVLAEEDVVVKLSEEQSLPTTKQKEEKTLKNEKEVYWKEAVDTYRQQIHSQFFNKFGFVEDD